MIRIVSITFGLVLVTIGGGISLSNAHGSAGKAAISSQDVFAPGSVMREPLAAPLQPAARTRSASVVTADTVTKDVMRADGFQWRTFGPSLAPNRGIRPQSRYDSQMQTAQISAPQALNPPTLSTRVTPSNGPVPLPRPTDARAAEAPVPMPAVKIRNMKANPTPGFLIGVFR